MPAAIPSAIGEVPPRRSLVAEHSLEGGVGVPHAESRAQPYGFGYMHEQASPNHHPVPQPSPLSSPSGLTSTNGVNTNSSTPPAPSSMAQPLPPPVSLPTHPTPSPDQSMVQHQVPSFQALDISARTVEAMTQNVNNVDAASLAGIVSTLMQAIQSQSQCIETLEQSCNRQKLENENRFERVEEVLGQVGADMQRISKEQDGFAAGLKQVLDHTEATAAGLQALKERVAEGEAEHKAAANKESVNLAAAVGEVQQTTHFLAQQLNGLNDHHQSFLQELEELRVCTGKLSKEGEGNEHRLVHLQKQNEEMAKEILRCPDLIEQKGKQIAEACRSDISAAASVAGEARAALRTEFTENHERALQESEGAYAQSRRSAESVMNLEQLLQTTQRDLGNLHRLWGLSPDTVSESLGNEQPVQLVLTTPPIRRLITDWSDQISKIDTRTDEAMGTALRVQGEIRNCVSQEVLSQTTGTWQQELAHLSVPIGELRVESANTTSLCEELRNELTQRVRDHEMTKALHTKAGTEDVEQVRQGLDTSLRTIQDIDKAVETLAYRVQGAERELISQTKDMATKNQILYMEKQLTDLRNVVGQHIFPQSESPPQLTNPPPAPQQLQPPPTSLPAAPSNIFGNQPPPSPTEGVQMQTQTSAPAAAPLPVRSEYRRNSLPATLKLAPQQPSQPPPAPQTANAFGVPSNPGPGDPSPLPTTEPVHQRAPSGSSSQKLNIANYPPASAAFAQFHTNAKNAERRFHTTACIPANKSSPPPPMVSPNGSKPLPPATLNLGISSNLQTQSNLAVQGPGQ